MWIGLVVEGPSLSCNNIYNFDAWILLSTLSNDL
jgi:hypothetical protein